MVFADDFLLGLLGYLLLQISGKKWIQYVVLAIAFGALFVPKLTDWLCVNDLLDCAFYFVLGMTVSDLFTENRESPPWKGYLFGTLSLAAAIMLFLCPDAHAVVMTLKTAMIACLMIFAVTCLLTPFARRYDPQAHRIFNRTFSIFILSWPCQLAVEVLTEHILHLDYYIIMPCMFIAGLILPCIIILLVDRMERKRKHKPLTRVIGG